MAASRLEFLRGIPDRRRAEGKRFDLATVLLCTILGMVAGANSYRQMHEFIRLHRQRLTEAFGLALRGALSYTGLRDILQGVDADALEAAFRAFLVCLWRDNQGENGASIWMRSGDRIFP